MNNSVSRKSRRCGVAVISVVCTEVFISKISSCCTRRCPTGSTTSTSTSVRWCNCRWSSTNWCIYRTLHCPSSPTWTSSTLSEYVCLSVCLSVARFLVFLLTLYKPVEDEERQTIMSDFDWFHTYEEFISINYITIFDELRIHWVDGPTVTAKCEVDRHR